MHRKITDARNLAAQFLHQAIALYQSSAPVIVQVNAAIERSVLLGEEVQAVVSNGTQLLQGSQTALFCAQAAVTNANQVYEHARKMLEVAKNFQAESHRAQQSANESLLTVATVRNNAHRIMTNVTAVSESSSQSLITATEALHLGMEVKNLSLSEKEVCVLLVNSFVIVRGKTVRPAINHTFVMTSEVSIESQP